MTTHTLSKRNHCSKAAPQSKTQVEHKNILLNIIMFNFII